MATSGCRSPVALDVFYLVNEVKCLALAWGHPWSGRQDSNLRSPAPKAGALATTLRPVTG